MEVITDILYILLISVPGVSLVQMLKSWRFIDKFSLLDTFIVGVVLWLSFLIFPFVIATAVFLRVNLDVLFVTYIIVGVAVICLGVIDHIMKKSGGCVRVFSFNPRSYIFIIIFGLLVYYAIIIFIIPVYYSYDAVTYYLPYAKAILRCSGFPSNYWDAYRLFGNSAGIPPSIILLYAYALYLFPSSEAFKLVPLIFLVLAISATYKIAEIIFKDRKIALASASLALSVPALYVFVGSTPYNLDLGLAAYYLVMVYSALKFVLTGDRFWGLFAGVSFSLTMLSKSYGFAYVIPFMMILSQVLRDRVRIIIPVGLAGLACLFEIMRGGWEHLAVAVNIMVLGILLSLVQTRYEILSSRGGIGVLRYVAPALIGPVWLIVNTRIFGSPFYPPLWQFLPGNLRSVFAWATNISSFIFEVKIRTFSEVMWGVPKLFVSPLIGCLLLISGSYALVNLVFKKDENMPDRYWLIVFLFLIEVMMWIWETRGDLYKTRHLLHQACIVSILSAYGLLSIMRRLGIKDRDEPIIFFSSALFCFMHWFYVSFDVEKFVIWRSELMLLPSIPLLLGIVAIFLTAVSPIFKSIRVGKVVAATSVILLFVTVSLPIGRTLYVISSVYGGDVSAYRWGIRGPGDHVDVIEYFRTHGLNGSIVVFGGYSLPYYLDGGNVIKLDLESGMIVLRDCLISDNKTWVYVRLREMGIRYVLVPNEKSSLYEKFIVFKNTTLVSMLRDEDYFILKERFSRYDLYELCGVGNTPICQKV